MPKAAINRIPLEILAQILACALTPRDFAHMILSTDGSRTRSVLSAVCHRWRSVFASNLLPSAYTCSPETLVTESALLSREDHTNGYYQYQRYIIECAGACTSNAFVDSPSGDGEIESLVSHLPESGFKRSVQFTFNVKNGEEVDITPLLFGYVLGAARIAMRINVFDGALAGWRTPPMARRMPPRSQFNGIYVLEIRIHRWAQGDEHNIPRAITGVYDVVKGDRNTTRLPITLILTLGAEYLMQAHRVSELWLESGRDERAAKPTQRTSLRDVRLCGWNSVLWTAYAYASNVQVEAIRGLVLVLSAPVVPGASAWGDWDVFNNGRRGFESPYLGSNTARQGAEVRTHRQWSSLEYLKIINATPADLPGISRLLHCQQGYDIVVASSGNDGIGEIQDLVTKHNDRVPRLFRAFGVVERREARRRYCLGEGSMPWRVLGGHWAMDPGFQIRG